MRAERFSRRGFLGHATQALGGSWLAASLPGIAAAAELAIEKQEQAGRWDKLDAQMASGLGAIADQIFPADDTPGAAEIGAVYFMDAAFGGFMSGALPAVREGYEDLERRSLELHATQFAVLGFAEQTELLRKVEKTPFFAITHFLTLCGVFALPAYGGNRDLAGWRLLEFEPRHHWLPPFGHYDAAYREVQPDAGA